MRFSNLLLQFFYLLSTLGGGIIYSIFIGKNFVVKVVCSLSVSLSVTLKFHQTMQRIGTGILVKIVVCPESGRRLTLGPESRMMRRRVKSYDLRISLRLKLSYQ